MEWGTPKKEEENKNLMFRISSVDDDVTFGQNFFQFLDEIVDRLAGLDHEHDPPGPLQLPDELVEGTSPDNLIMTLQINHLFRTFQNSKILLSLT